MKFCQECGTQITGNGKFCSNCGAALNHAESTHNNATASNCLQSRLVSQSCRQRLEAEWRSKPALAHRLSGMIAIFLSLLVWGPLIFAYLRGEPEHKLDEYAPDLGLAVFAVFCMIGVVIFVHYLVSKLKENYDQYIGHCEKEYLEVNETGISGNTFIKNVNLNYEDISRVTTFSNDQITKFAVIKVDVLKIEDRFGESYCFYSFDNTDEISIAIRRHPAYATGQSVKSNVEPLGEGRVRCSKCGQVQMAGRVTCCSCNASFTWNQ